MGRELREVVETIMSDLGMGEEQGKIDALEHALGENLATFFSGRTPLFPTSPQPELVGSLPS